MADERDDWLTVCATALLAWILTAISHEGLGHALTALLTGAQSGVVSTEAWTSAHDTPLIAAAGTIVNLIEAVLLRLVLAGAPSLSLHTRLFLFAATTFNILTGTGYFLFSGIGNAGDWATVIAGLDPSWAWRALLIVVGVTGYIGALRLMGAALVRDLGVARVDKPRMKELTWLLYFSALALSMLAGAMNPLGWDVFLVSAVAAAAGGNAGLLWLRHYVPKDVTSAQDEEYVLRSWAWIGAAAIFSLAFIFILGPGITLHHW